MIKDGPRVPSSTCFRSFSKSSRKIHAKMRGSLQQLGEWDFGTRYSLSFFRACRAFRDLVMGPPAEACMQGVELLTGSPHGIPKTSLRTFPAHAGDLQFGRRDVTCRGG